MELVERNQEHERAAVRDMILQTEERIRELHAQGGGNKKGLGATEAWRTFSSELDEFVGNADNVLPLTPEEMLELNQLIQSAANGTLDTDQHREELEHFLDYYMRYRSAREIGH